MSTRRHPLPAPSAGRLAAVLGVGWVATGAPGGQDESDVQINEELLEQLTSQLKSIHSPCIIHLRGSELEHVLVNMIEQLARSLSTVVGGTAAVANATEVELELDNFQAVWRRLMDDSFSDDTFEQVAKETADTLDRFTKLTKLTKQEVCKETLLRFMTDRMHRFCIDYGIDAITEMTRVVEKSADLLSTVGNDGEFHGSRTEVMDVETERLFALGSLEVLMTYRPGRLETRSVMDLPDGKYESAMDALRDAVNEIRDYVESVVQA